MAIKITADKSRKIDIVARRGDDFIVNLEIKDESGSMIPFTRDGYTFDKQVAALGNPSLEPLITEKLKWAADEDVMLFVVTTEDDTPVLAACSSDLDLAMYHSTLDPTIHLDSSSPAVGLYKNPSNQRDFDKKYNEMHAGKVIAVSKAIAKSSHKNTELERSNYGTDNLAFSSLGIRPLAEVQSTNLDMTSSDHYSDWLYSIFTNQEVVKSSGVLDIMINYIPSLISSTGNEYIFWGRVEGNNSFSIKFDHNRFNLPAGSYKYTFKSLSDYRHAPTVASSVGINMGVDKDEDLLFINSTTWLHGKLKINE
tara:strand:+ start:173 stop:1102 length:930 start_codon:yes stop_codon:yes gene_type:complete